MPEQTTAGPSAEPKLAAVPSGSPGYWLSVDFLVDEARALDENRLTDWIEMLHPEIEYRVPIRVTRERTKGLGFSEEGFHLDEGYDSLSIRVDRLATDYAWAEDPPSRTRRFVSNFRTFELENGDLRVKSNLLIYRERLDELKPQVLSAERHDDLRELDGGPRLARRLVLLDHTTLLTPNLGIFL
jgi:3-phenylpropionate/cinnamic acid dioxygenase small subunit